MKKNFLIVLLLILILHSCSLKNNFDNNSIQIPPPQYYTLFLDNLEKNIPVNISDTNYINWYNSKVIYQTWKNKLNDFSITYKALYLMYFQNANSFDEYTDYREVTFDTNNNSYKFLLYSSNNSNDDVEWEMHQYINNSSKYNIVLKGINTKLFDNGKWTFYQTINSNIPKLIVYWKQTDSALQLIFSDIDTNQIERSFFKVTENYFVSNYKYMIENFNYDTKNYRFIEIEKDKNIGRIKDSVYYKDEKWHYWSF